MNANRPQKKEPPDRRAAGARYGVPQVAGILYGVALLVVAIVLNSPAGRALGDGGALHFVLLFANVGSLLAVLGLALGKPDLAWPGAALFVAVGFLVSPIWYAAPFALVLMGFVAWWEASRPRPPRFVPVPASPAQP
ncbi:MAG: hypothetical protein V4510_01310 [bacterium]